MRIGSLFAGIGGLELGLEWAGVGETVWQVEQDPFCRRVLAKHWPRAERFEDVKDVGAHNLSPVDLICGGFPCTDISLAGKGAGLEGEASGLWWEFARVIRDLRPRFVVLENVAALLGRGFGRVLGALAESGYDAEWDCVPAAAVGAPHRRDRVFVVAWRVSDAVGDAIRLEPERGEGAAYATDGGDAELGYVGARVVDTNERGPQGERVAGEQGQRGKQGARGYIVDGCGGEAMGDTARGGCEAGALKQSAQSSPEGCFWPPSPDDLHLWSQLPPLAQPSIRRCTDGVPAGLVRDRRKVLKALGNAVVPQVAYWVGRRVLEIEESLG
jgi:DNA (cytosine-5)-methyltransferase 1